MTGLSTLPVTVFDLFLDRACEAACLPNLDRQILKDAS